MAKSNRQEGGFKDTPKVVKAVRVGDILEHSTRLVFTFVRY
jgi:hypothetical protein